MPERDQRQKVRSPQPASFAAWAVVSSSGTMPAAGVAVEGLGVLFTGHPRFRVPADQQRYANPVLAAGPVAAVAARPWR
jgi:hypothetical protein